MRKPIAILLSIVTLLGGLSLAMADDITVTTGVDKYLVVTFQYSSVDFGSLTKGTDDNVPTPSHATGAYNVTVDTNYDYKFTVNGTDFTGATSSFGIENLTIGMNATKENLDVSDSVAVSTSPVVVEQDIPYTQTLDYHGFWLDIPSDQYAESYSTTVTFTYLNM